MTSRLSSVPQRAAELLPTSRVLVVGSQYDVDCREIRSFLAMNRIPTNGSTANASRNVYPAVCPRTSVGRPW